MTELQNRYEFLVDRWCEGRNLEPLRFLLNAHASLNGLTDGWADFHTDVRSIKARYASKLPNDELEAVVDLICIADKALERK